MRERTAVWADRYDRDVADVFAIESELAGKIVAQLQAKISPSERRQSEQKPTADLAAYDLYVRARHSSQLPFTCTPYRRPVRAFGMLNQTIERDPPRA